MNETSTPPDADAAVTGTGPRRPAGPQGAEGSPAGPQGTEGSARRGDSRRTGDPLISARGVDKFFGDFQALKGIDLDIHRGEVVALDRKSVV